MNTINKDQLVKRMTEINTLTQKDNKEALDTVMKVIMDIVAEGDKITLVGFGSFEPKHNAERQGTNPSTGEKITIKANNSARFKIGKKFKESLN